MLRRLLVTGLGVLGLAAGNVAMAHEGHDHDKPPPLNLPVAPRVVAVTPDFELVGVSSGKNRITVFLHNFATNEPVKGAKISVSTDAGSADAKPEGDGVFTLSAPWLSGDKPVDLVFALTLANGTQDLLAGQLEKPASAGEERSVGAHAGWYTKYMQQWQERPELVVAGLGGLMTGILITLLVAGSVGRKRAKRLARSALPPAASLTSESSTVPDPADGDASSGAITPLRRTAGASALLLAMLGTLALGIAAGPVHAAGPNRVELPSVPSTMATDLAQRMPDSTLFVPKATQHLLSLRTMVTARTAAPRSIELTGNIIAGPEHFGRVQPGRPGRIEAVPGGLAFIGKRVKKGDLLAYVGVYIEAADRANIDSQIAETEARIDKNRTILSRYERSPGAVPQVRVDEVRGELEALKRKRAELLPSVGSREPITAPIDGVVSVANVTIGQIVDARDIIFEIVDPSEFWVEAIAHDVEATRNIEKAHAVVKGQDPIPLEFAGRGLALRQQASVVTFRVTGNRDNLSVGMPVKVVIESTAKVDGFIVPASAVVRGQTGLPIVWVKTEPERFEPQIVKTAPLDGRYVVITAGLKDDIRIVTDGVTLLNQVR